MLQSEHFLYECLNRPSPHVLVLQGHYVQEVDDQDIQSVSTVPLNGDSWLNATAYAAVCMAVREHGVKIEVTMVVTTRSSSQDFVI